MAAYFIVHIEIPDQNDRGSYDEYITKVRPIVESYGGEYLVRSEHISLFAGARKPDRIIVVRFADRRQLDRCFTSPEYNSVKMLRENSVRTTAFIVEQHDIV